MRFELDPEEEMIRDTARRIAADRLAPLAARLDSGEGHGTGLRAAVLAADVEAHEAVLGQELQVLQELGPALA